MRVSVHLDAVLGEVASMIRNTFPKNITLEIRHADKSWLVAGDPTHLNQVILNLAVNARDSISLREEAVVHFHRKCLCRRPGRREAIVGRDGGPVRSHRR